ncbi:MAG: nucleoside transporter [Acidobacteria bacterium]|nr:nucleoside transporter [Acidobacteriota bacterium]
MNQHFVSFLGFLALVLIACIFSTNRRRINWRAIGAGLILQLVIGLVVFRLPLSRRFFVILNDLVMAVLDASKAGTGFLLGPLAIAAGETGSIGFILAFQALPIAIFFSALVAALYHLRLMQPLIRVFARIFHRTLGISGAEALSSSSNIFVGVESALVVQPYLALMTRSELMLLLTSGMATVASTTLGIYVSLLSTTFPQIAGHLISASIISIPAATIISKILLPETESPVTIRDLPQDDNSLRSANLMSAIIAGAMDGLRLIAGISALLVAGLGLVALIDRVLALPTSWLGLSAPLSIARILAWIFYPFAALLGIVQADIPQAARLLGERVILTEVIPYQELAAMAANGELTDPRTVVIMSYALCGFAHFASAAIFVGGTAALAPTRRDDLAGIALRALLAATLATLMTGCVAGMFSTGNEVLLGLKP